jgi:DNA-binding LacI/PurR family transcriptional regulator
VSLWTVSNAFSHPERIAPSTRERVLRAAAALDYAGPDPLARSLASGRTGVIALVASGAAEPLLADPAAAQIARGLARACDRAGISLLLTGRADGTAADGWALLRQAAPAGRPAGAVVAVDAPAHQGVTPVGADVAGGAAQAARHLADLGHRRLSILSWPSAGAREDGARAGWGATGPVDVVVAGAPAGPHGRPAGTGRAQRAVGPMRSDGVEAARVALRRDPRPTAILALSDALAVGALEAVRWTGLRVPGDVSVVGVDDLPDSAGVGLTSVFVPYEPMGELAGATLAAIMRDGRAAAPAPLPTALTVRGTSAPPPGGRRAR